MSTRTSVVRQKAGSKRRQSTVPIRRSPRQNAGKIPGFYNENILAGKRRRFGIKDGMIEPLPPPTLPLTQSYVDALEKMRPEAPQRPPRQTWPTPETPITWPNDPDIPKDWTSAEIDLDPADLDAQLVRVDERIANKILPQMFEQKKKQLLRLKAEQDAMIESESAYPGLSMDVIRRLHDLKHMEKQLETRGKDPCGMLPNIRALITAYRTKQLEWTPGLVTYWSKGDRICQPRPFHYEEFLEINQAHDGHTDFWVEGLFPLGPQSQQPALAQEYCASGHNWIRDVYLALRFPNNRQTQMQFQFMEDTGASYMTMFIEDFDLLEQASGGRTALAPPLLGALNIAGFQGGIGDLYQIRALEVNMAADGNGRLMTAWDWMPVVIYENPAHEDRLSGPYIHYKFYTGSAPDGSGKGYAFDLKGGWKGLVPTITDVRLCRQPQFGTFAGSAAAIAAFNNMGRTVMPGASTDILGWNNFVGLPNNPPKRPPPGLPVGQNPSHLRQPAPQQVLLPLPPPVLPPPGGGIIGGGGPPAGVKLPPLPPGGFVYVPGMALPPGVPPPPGFPAGGGGGGGGGA